VCRNIGSEYAKANEPKNDHTKYPCGYNPGKVSENLVHQNPELAMKEESIVQKFCNTTKIETRNLVIDVNSDIQKKISYTTELT
jgi:hypothetical protein